MTRGRRAERPGGSRPGTPSGGGGTGGQARSRPRNQALGEYGERLAARELENRGLTVIDRNWSCPHGEIDLVALDGETLVVVEVKTRRSTRFGSPAEAVVPAKLARLRRLTWLWLEEHRDQVPAYASVRIDVVAIWCAGRQLVRFEHLAGVP